MIGWFDAFTLACTKLRSKRILLIITIVLSGLLFGVLYAAVILATGASDSATSYTKSALDDRYLVVSNPVIPTSIYGPVRTDGLSEDLTAKLTALQDAYIAKQKTQSEKFNIPFDKSVIQPVFKPDPFGRKNSDGSTMQIINNDSPVFQEYVEQLQRDYAKTATNKLSDLKKAAAPYGATAFYQNNQATSNYLNLNYLANGQENLETLGQFFQPSTPTTSGYATASVRNSIYTFSDESLIQRFILPENDTRKENDSAIPVVITTEEAVDLFGEQLGISKQPTEAADQIAWMQNLQKKINGQTYTACYRNSVEIGLINQAKQTNTALAENKDNVSYTAPDLIYNLPTTSCGDITVKKDTRTAAEKLTVSNQEALQKDEGTYQAPSHQLLTFQIVGIMSLTATGTTVNSLPSFVSELLGAQYDTGAFIPNQLYSALPDAAQYKDILQNYDSVVPGNGQALRDAEIGQAIVAFTSLKSARDFISQQGCAPINQEGCPKPFTLTTYGSNYLLMDDFSNLVISTARIALPIAIIIAAVIIWITMTRVIIDSRRETAVFRALGAKRGDIMSIYLLYSLIVAILIIVFAVLLGLGMAFVVESLYSTQATNYAKVVYGVFDQLKPFSFIGINLPLLGGLAFCILAVSFIAVLPPLGRNVRRNPIRDMRNDG